MTHEDVQERAFEFVLGTLPATEQRAVVSHLSGCPACRAESRGRARSLRSRRSRGPQCSPASTPARRSFSRSCR